MNNTIKHITAVVGLPIVLAGAATLSSAGNWVADYSLDADIAYDDNFFMADEEQDTWVYSVKPEVSMIYVSPVAKSQLDARLAFKRYSDFDQFDSEDPAFDWKNSYKTQRSNWSFNTGYSENSQRDAAEQDVGIFDSNTIVKTIYIDPGVDIELTEKDELGISLHYNRRDYDANDFSDNDTQTIGLNWRHHLNEVLTTTAMVSASNYSADRVAISANETDYIQTTVGFIYQYSEAMTIDGSAGYFETDAEARFLAGPILLISETESNGTLLNLGLHYDTENDTFSFNLSRGLYPSSQGEVEERDSVGVGYEHQFSGRSSTGISIAWYDTGALSEERESVTVSPFYSYRLTEKLQLKTTYIFRRFDRQTTLNEVDSNRVNLGLRYSF